MPDPKVEAERLCNEEVPFGISQETYLTAVLRSLMARTLLAAAKLPTEGCFIDGKPHHAVSVQRLERMASEIENGK